MKKLLAALAFCSMSSITLAQDFGKMLISGSASFSTNKSENVVTYGEMRSTRFAISPSVGFFVNPKIAVGAYGSYSLNSAPFTLGQSSSGEYPIIENKISAYSFGSFARAYQPIGTKVAFFGQLSAFYTRSKTEYDEGELSSSLHFY
ncbi:hypothetical protein [Rufibacter roseolus]|uniref:hypothetical protein n=1 Tax=Rufibacter roseolus TaxID=2817375 RepID=UPI001B304434|nr:hypothetical protein [Rufibacter roseolus]